MQIPKDIQTKASNRAHTLSARMLIVEYYLTAIPGPDVIAICNVKVHKNSNKYSYNWSGNSGQHRVMEDVNPN